MTCRNRPRYDLYDPYVCVSTILVNKDDHNVFGWTLNLAQSISPPPRKFYGAHHRQILLRLLPLLLLQFSIVIANVAVFCAAVNSANDCFAVLRQSQKTAAFYFFNNFVKPRSIVTIFGIRIPQ